MNSQFDVIVVGSGHNGLIAANYLSDAGKRVAVVERRGLVGGATVTEEVIPGFRASACSYVSGLLHPQILQDLRLKEFGLDLYQTEMGSASILRDGRHLFLYNDLSRTLREMQDVAAADSDALVAFGLRLERFASITNQWLLTPSPPSVHEVMEVFYESGEGDLFTEFFTLSVLDLLDRYFSTDIVKGLFTFLAIVSVWGGPRTPGWSYVYGHHATGEFNGHMGQFAFPRGGMGAIAESLAARAKARGASVRTHAPVESIIVERGRAAGVVIEGGEELRAPVVLSNADPRRTFLSLVDSRYLPDEYVRQVAKYDTRGSMARVFLALDSLPEFIGCPPGMGPQHRGLTLVGAEVENFQRIGDAQQQGWVPDDFPIEFIIQTASDDTLAPRGKHLLSTGIQQLPFELAQGTWDDYRSEFTDKVINILSDYSPGIKDRIIGTHTITPLDLEREYALPGGNIFHGAMTLGQLYSGRPVPGYESYRSPVPGLYLCGAGTHPGGGVMGAPGYNAAKAVLTDEAAGGWHPGSRKSTSSVASAPLRHRLMSKPKVRKVALALARQPLLAPLVDRASKR